MRFIHFQRVDKFRIVKYLLLSDIVRRNITSVTGQWRYMGRSVLNRWENSGNLNRVGALISVSVGNGWRKMVWKAEPHPWASSPGQKLASIYRSRVSRRIIISCNWSRENSVLVSRTDALVFPPTLWLCERGKLSLSFISRWNAEISQDLEIWFRLESVRKNIPFRFARNMFIYLKIR